MTRPYRGHHRRARRSAWRLVTPLVAAAALAGCGSTVPLTDQRALSSRAVGPGTAPDSALSSSAPADLATDGTATSGALAPLVTSAPGSAVASTHTSVAAPTASGTTSPVPGVVHGRVRLGFIVARNGDAATKAVGINNVSYGDQDAYVAAVINQINKTGGIAGMPAAAVKVVNDGTSTQDVPTFEQGACEKWIRDERVFAVLLSTRMGSDGIIPACLERAGIPMVTALMSTTDEQTLQSRRMYLELADLNLTLQSRLLVEDLVKRGVLTPGTVAKPTRVGLVRFDCPGYRKAAAHGFKPALAAHHLVLSDEKVVTYCGGGDTFAAEVQNAVLTFASHGVTHVALMEQGGLLSIAFMNAAQSQQYYPTYMLDSQNSLDLLSGTVATSQLRNAKGIGWLPGLDLPDGAKIQAPGRAGCVRSMHQYGVSSLTADAYVFCDTAFFTQRTAAALVGRLSAERFMDLARRGPRFASALTFAAQITPQHYDGALLYRPVVFDQPCKCFRYAGPAVTAR